MKRRSFLAGLSALTLVPKVVRSSLVNWEADLAVKLSEAGEGEEYWELVKSVFPLKPGLFYFNNASLGPSPEPVIKATETFSRLLESFPSRYMWGGWNEDKEQVRQQAANLFGVSAEEIALIHNTTEGMNIIARSLDLKPGDEVILADHEHPSGTIPWQVWQETRGVKLVRPKLPLIPGDEEELVAVYRRAITDRTRVISMCHLVNTNGMMLPVKKVCELAHRRGILVAVDGAQTAGMFLFNLYELGCDFFATSTHKWLFSPKGMGILYARKDVQHLLRPLMVASGYQTTSIRRLENYNTRNLPELLGLGSALAFHQLIGPERKAARIRRLKKKFLTALQNDARFRVKTPQSDDLSCGVVTVEVVDRDVRAVREELLQRLQIDCRPMTSHRLNGVRISLSVFNTLADVEYLVTALRRVAAG